MACYVEITGGGDESGPPNENATVEVHPDRTATILTGTSPHGQGHATAWTMIASEELGIPGRQDHAQVGDTDLIPVGMVGRAELRGAVGEVRVQHPGDGVLAQVPGDELAGSARARCP